MDFTYDAAGNRIKLVVDLKMGDFDGNGIVDMADAIAILQIGSHRSAGSVMPSIFTDVDADGNGKIGMEEAIFVLQVIAGIR